MVRRFGPLLAVGPLLAAAAVAAMLATPQIRRSPLAPPSLPPVLPPTAAGQAPSQVPERQIPTEMPRDVQLPGWLMLAAQVLCVLLVLTAVALLLWYLLRNGLRMRERQQELTEQPPVQTREEVLAAGDARPSAPDGTHPAPRRAAIAGRVRAGHPAAAARTPRGAAGHPPH